MINHNIGNIPTLVNLFLTGHLRKLYSHIFSYICYLGNSFCVEIPLLVKSWKMKLDVSPVRHCNDDANSIEGLHNE